MEKSPSIKTKHLGRKAIVYVRQSTEEQVRDNTGSTDYQRGQVRHAVESGWATHMIEVMQGDLCGFRKFWPL